MGVALDGSSDRSVGVVPAGRRQPEPCRLAGVAQPVQPGRAVVLKPGGQQAALPGDSRRLESLQLLQRAGQAGLAHQLGAGRHVLPPKEEPHEVLGRRRLDRLRRVRLE